VFQLLLYDRSQEEKKNSGCCCSKNDFYNVAMTICGIVCDELMMVMNSGGEWERKKFGSLKIDESYVG